MFTVGEFSKIAQVSKRLLRYYDEIGIFTPARIDIANNRRFYSAEQMPILNRILAMKDLGLSLEQIQRLLTEQVSVDEMQGMLLLKKAEIERHLQTEAQRIRRIESRLEAIRNIEEDKPLNVIMKQMPAQSMLSTRVIAETFETGLDMLWRIRAHLPENKRYGLCFCICHEDNLTMWDMDLEIGCFIESDSHAIVPLSDSMHLKYGQLPAVDMMATSIVSGPLERILIGYTQIAKWAEVNGYRTLGMPREVTLKLPRLADGSDMISEVQFAVEPLQ